MRACANCRLIVEEADECPSCQSKNLTEKFMGQIVVIDPENSEIGKKLEVKAPGRYAIKIQGQGV
ncbi:MAG: DNA-directed RNA polymerase subunit E'' [Candidatus Micrarchaeota archaeon]|nr:DNA-directed RNA polymerase subunit E'' [Candidatus Micrarchaeota archaeon]